VRVFTLAHCVSPSVRWRHRWAKRERPARLSIESPHPSDGQYINGFKIETWGVEILELCHLSPDWDVRKERFEAAAGLLRGEADHQSELNDPRPAQLRSLFLVDVYDYRPVTLRDGGTTHPASFAGWIKFGSVGSPPTGKWLKLAAGDLNLAKATQCPVPPAARP
jgi:hypothetical protein